MSEAKRPSLSSGIYYRDPCAALKWLEDALGFEPTMVVINEDGTIGHSEMRFGGGMIMVGREWDERHKSPASIGGANTQAVHIQLETGIDEHHERALKAGATVLRELADQFYGDRTYMIADPEGHVWSIGQTLRNMSNDEMASASPGVVIRERL